MVARVAIFDEAPKLHDDERRVASLRETVKACPGFVAGYHLRDEAAGRLMSVTVWESDEAMMAGDEKVRSRRASDQRAAATRPSQVERWVGDGAFRPSRGSPAVERHRNPACQCRSRQARAGGQGRA